MPTALIRPVPDSLPECQLTHVARAEIDVDLARAEHEAYERVLVDLGCGILHVEPAPDLPDSVFVEDTAVVLEEIAIIARPGARSRRPETPAVAAALVNFRPVTFLVAPATLDGGDVLRLGRTLYVATGGRTNADGARQLADAARLHGYRVRVVAAQGCLHLKSAVTDVAPGVVLVNPDWIDPSIFEGHRAIHVHPEEPLAGNVLRIGDTVICASAHARTNARLDAAGLALQPIDVSELGKAEGGLTCCSVIVD